MENSEIKKWYNSYTSRQKKVGINERHLSILSKVKAQGLSKDCDVLEIGCGIGTFTKLLKDFITDGNILAIDISDESIKEAKEKYNAKNLNFIAADATSYDFKNKKYDVIVLPDVIEHIPLRYHYDLFKTLSSVLKDNGIIFIHIPNPYFLEWCHENRTDLLQIIDQPIYTKELVRNISDHDLYIHKLETYSIWVKENDYQAITLKKEKKREFTIGAKSTPSFFEKITCKIKNGRK